MKEYNEIPGNGTGHRPPSGKSFTKKLDEILLASDWEERIEYLDTSSATNLIAPLFTALCSKTSLIRWHGITGFGIVLKSLTQKDYEKARDVMRRCIWNLNDESGGIGWGAPEVMGEIMACSGELAREFYTFLFSYIHEENDGMDNFLEFTPLRRGVFWGISRLAQVYPELVRRNRDTILRRIHVETEPEIIGLLCWTSGLIHMAEAVDFLRGHQHNSTEIELYRDRILLKISIGHLANEALDLIGY